MQGTNGGFSGRARRLFREPQRGRFNILLVLIGLSNLGYGLFGAGALGRSLQFIIIALGTWILLTGAAELLPRNQRLIAGLLRIGGYVALALVVILSLSDLLL